ncbi:MAG: serine hydrolase [Cyanobacteria bacterium P01_D01_bin.1]
MAFTILLFLLGTTAFLKSTEFTPLSFWQEEKVSIVEAGNEDSTDATDSNSILEEETIKSAYADYETIDRILSDTDFLEQTNLWDGKILLVRDMSNPSEQILQYYHYSSQYEDTNDNNIQDSLDKGFFNPASTVKVSLVGLVLEKLNEIDVSRDAEYRIKGTQDWYSFEDDIRRALVISDNNATNRLILWLGFDHIGNSLRNKGLSNLIVNRLMLDRGTLVPSPAFEIRLKTEVIQQSRQTVEVAPKCYEIDSKIGNCATATDLVEGLIRIIQPEYYDVAENFKLRKTDRVWMQNVMSHTPREEGFNYENNYCRFLTRLEKKFASKSGKMLSKCGISLFTNTYTDLSYLETDMGNQYYILLSVSPPRSVSEETVLLWMNQVAEAILVNLS